MVRFQLPSTAIRVSRTMSRRAAMIRSQSWVEPIAQLEPAA
jgi:hypothetical protein